MIGEYVIMEHNVSRDIDCVSVRIIYTVALLTMGITNKNTRFSTLIEFMVDMHIFGKT